MIKLLPVALIIVIVSSGFIYFRFFSTNQNPDNLTSSTVTESEGPVEVPKTSPGATTEDRVKILEDAVVEIVKKINDLTDPKTEDSSTNRLNSIEASITDLKTRISALESPAASTQTQASNPPLYIPLGSGGVNSDSNWSSIPTFEITLDPQDYAGYSNMQLEINFRLPSLVGTGYARLYNATDSTATSSELSTTSGTYVWATTASFKLASGKKTYKLQTKSSASKDVEIQSARIKVNF